MKLTIIINFDGSPDIPPQMAAALYAQYAADNLNIPVEGQKLPITGKITGSSGQDLGEWKIEP